MSSITTMLALAILVLTPVWSLGYYNQPFAKVLLEPNNIVDNITGKDWPVYQAGAGVERIFKLTRSKNALAIVRLPPRV